MNLQLRGKAEPSWIPKFNRQRLFFYAIVVFLGFVFVTEVVLFNGIETSNQYDSEQKENWFVEESNRVAWINPHADRRIRLPEHLVPHVPIVPLFDSIPNAEQHIANTMEGRPSMVGVVAVLQKFISELHKSNQDIVKHEHDGYMMIDRFFDLAARYIKPFDNLYHGKPIFPQRYDDSIFISIAAFREQFLLQTLTSAFKNAKHPEKVFVGAVIQNCFGKILPDGTLDASGTPCQTGTKQVGEDEFGKPIKKKLDVPPDVNGVEAFCKMPDFKVFCDNGQFRVLYIHDVDSQGPSMARYFASKLYGGETYYMQIDSHLRFAHQWDAKYIKEYKLTKSYPKTVFSMYPPGFEQIRFIPGSMGIDKSKITDKSPVIESPGCKLCHCSTKPKEANPIIHINQSKGYRGNETSPRQTPFLGAGFVFARGELLVDVPYDPYLPWTFFGEEILLSMRAWTSGWDIYAPRKNLVLHQYRPPKLGLPKFHTTIAATYKKGFGNHWMQVRVLNRIKHLCGYPSHTAEKIKSFNQSYLLIDSENYGMGTARTWEDFLKHADIRVNYTTGLLDCPRKLQWCLDGTKE